MVENPFEERVVDGSRELERLLRDIRESGIVALDTETDGLKWALGNKPFMLTACPNLDVVYAVYDAESALAVMQEAERNVQVFHNAKFDHHMIRMWTGYAPNYLSLNLEDTMHAFRLQYPLDSAALKEASFRFCADLIDVTGPQRAVKDWMRENTRKERMNGEWVKVEPTYKDVPFEIMLPYAIQDAWMTLKCHYELEKLRDPAGKLNGLYKREVRLVKLLIEMEKYGWHLNHQMLMDRLNESASKFQEALAEFQLIAPGVLHSSPKQLANYIYGTLGEEVRHLTKPRKKINPDNSITILPGNPSTDETALLLMTHKEEGRVALNVRRWKKARDKYSELALYEMADSAVHTDFKPERAKTGRFGCSSPALQNIANPNPEEPWTMAREVFTPRPGMEWLLVDYSQIEMRIFAHYCKDRYLLEAINNGVDLHSLTASRMYGVDVSVAKATKMMRAFGKIMNFTIIYGGGVNKIATALKEGSAQNDPLTLEEAQRALLVFVPYASASQLANPFVPLAKALKSAYFSQFPDIQRFMDAVQDKVRERYSQERRGYVMNVFGRMTPVPIERAYVAVNYIVQGSAADLLKDAMINCWDQCIEFAGMHGLTPWKDIAEFANIHDEILFEVPIGMAHSLALHLEPTLTNWPMFSVPIKADYALVEQGSSWAFKKSFNLQKAA